jgi:hypothetical protein
MKYSLLGIPATKKLYDVVSTDLRDILGECGRHLGELRAR